MTCSGWRSPPPIIRDRARIAAGVSPLSIASVSSHGGTPPASPRNGSTSASRSRWAVPCAEASVSRIPASRPASSPSQRLSRSRACASRRSPAAVTCSSNQSARSRALLGGALSIVSAPARLSASDSDLGSRPPPVARTSSVVGRTSPSRSTSGATSPAANRPTPRATTTRRSVRNGGVCAASTTERSSYSSPSNSSTISDRSPSPTRRWTSSPTAADASDGSSPATTCTLMPEEPGTRRPELPPGPGRSATVPGGTTPNHPEPPPRVGDRTRHGEPAARDLDEPDQVPVVHAPQPHRGRRPRRDQGGDQGRPCRRLEVGVTGSASTCASSSARRCWPTSPTTSPTTSRSTPATSRRTARWPRAPRRSCSCGSTPTTRTCAGRPSSTSATPSPAT